MPAEQEADASAPSGPPAAGAVEEEAVVYGIDASDRLIHVSRSWESFAQQNAVEGLPAAHVLGKVLWDFISDATTGRIYRSFCQRVREGAPAIRFHFRCDSAQRERLLEMTISDAGSGSVEFHVAPVGIRDRAADPVVAAAIQRGASEMLCVCSWCERFRIDATTWAPVATAAQAQRIFTRSPVPSVTHGICEDCEKALTNEWSGTLRLDAAYRSSGPVS